MLTYQGARYRARIMRTWYSSGRAQGTARALCARRTYQARACVHYARSGEENCSVMIKTKGKYLSLQMQSGWCWTASGRPLMREVLTGAN